MDLERAAGESVEQSPREPNRLEGDAGRETGHEAGSPDASNAPEHAGNGVLTDAQKEGADGAENAAAAENAPVAAGDRTDGGAGGETDGGTDGSTDDAAEDAAGPANVANDADHANSADSQSSGGFVSGTFGNIFSRDYCPLPENVRTINYLSLLSDIAHCLSSIADVKESLEAVLSLLARRMHMMQGTITLVSPETGEIRIEASYGLKPAERSRGHYMQGEGIIGHVVQSGQPMYISSVSNEPRFLNRTRSRDPGRGDISYICVPIRLNRQVVGALSVDRLLTDEQQLEEEEQLLFIIAMLLGFAAWEAQRKMDEDNAMPGRPRGFIGNSEVMQRVYAQIMQVSRSPATVFLQGESGTGKELAARAIHNASSRAENRFEAINCAALPENLVESELFGYEKGAFTGAVATRKGRFELANNGTLFLDEVGELSLMAQAKLLRVLQERTIDRIGGSGPIPVDVRLIAATNRDLEKMVEEGTFRRDLYYRLNVFPIVLPPLRERQDDIMPLASHFAKRFAREAGKEDVRMSLAAMDMLQRYSWPGNIRELENAMERAVLLLGSQSLILPQHLPTAMHVYGGTVAEGGETRPRRAQATLQEHLDELEKACIVDALEASEGQMAKAAKALGLTQRILGLRMRKYKLDYKDFRPNYRGKSRQPRGAGQVSGRTAGRGRSGR